MRLLLKKAERKKKRRKNHYNTENIIELKNIVDRQIDEEISTLNNTTKCDVSLYNNSNIISNIEEFKYKPLNYILEKYT